MSLQQINLYQDTFKEKAVPMSAAQILTIFLLLIFVVSAYSLYLENSQTQVEKRNKELLSLQQAIAQETLTLRNKLTKLLANNKFDLEIKDVRNEIKARQKVLKFVENNQFLTGQGYSSYMSALADLVIKDVWLDDIQFSEQSIRIKGSSLRAEHVPLYFKKFSQEDIFKGKKFDVFYIDRTEKRDWKIDFLIQTREDQEPVDE